MNKRYREDVVVTLPAVLNVGGGRANALPTYVQGGDDHTASVVEADTIVQKAYLIVDEAFAATATVTVKIGATEVFAGTTAITSTGIQVSATEDLLVTAKSDVTITVGTLTGDVTTGKLRVVLACDHPSLNNGQYAN